jgi:hypothetical protein
MQRLIQVAGSLLARGPVARLEMHVTSPGRCGDGGGEKTLKVWENS